MAGYRQIHTKIWSDAWFMEQSGIMALSRERERFCFANKMALLTLALASLDKTMAKTLTTPFWFKVIYASSEP